MPRQAFLWRWMAEVTSGLDPHWQAWIPFCLGISGIACRKRTIKQTCLQRQKDAEAVILLRFAWADALPPGQGPAKLINWPV